MKHRHFDRLGNGGIRFTELGFGSAPIGNLYRTVTEVEAQSALEAAWAGGDGGNAPMGAGGEGEQLQVVWGRCDSTWG